MVLRSGLAGICVAALLMAAQTTHAQVTTGPANPADPLRSTIDDPAIGEPGAPEQPAAALPQLPPEIPAPPPRPRRKTLDDAARRGIGGDAIKLFPALETGIAVSTNPNQRRSNRKTAVGLRVAPRLRLQSDWARHELRLEARGEYIDYFDKDIAASRSANVQANLRLDIRRSTYTDLEVAYELSQERAANTQGAEPRSEHAIAGGVAVTHDFGGASGTLGLRLTRFIAEDVTLANGTIEDNSDRNYIAPEVFTRLALRPQAAISPYIELAADRRTHDEEQNRFGERTDSTGLRAALGIQVSGAPFWEGSLALTYLWRDFADAGLGTIDNVGLTGGLIWRPADFASVVFNASAGLDDTQNAGEAATRTWSAGLTAAYGVTDFVSLTADAKVNVDDGIGPADITTSLAAGAEWNVNPFLGFTLRGETLWFNSGAPNDDYAEQRLLASMIVQR